MHWRCQFAIYQSMSNKENRKHSKYFKQRVYLIQSFVTQILSRLTELTRSWGVSGIPKTTLRTDDSAKQCTEFRKAVILMVTVYNSRRIQVKISKGKRRSEVQEKPGTLFHVSSPSEVTQTHVILPVMKWQHGQGSSPSPVKSRRTLWGSWAQKPFRVPSFLLVGNRLQPPGPSLSSKGQIWTVANQGREGMQRQGRSSQETIVQLWGRVLVPPP